MDEPEASQVDRGPLSGRRFDAFVSFAEDDRNWAEGFLLRALTASGVSCCTVADFPAGMPLLEAVTQAIESSARVVVVISPAYLADQIQPIVGLLGQHFGVEHRTWPVVPIVLRATTLPLPLRVLNPVVATDQEQWIPAVDRLCRDLGRSLVTDAAAPECPYRGVRAYDEEHRSAFFGREDEIAAATRYVNLNPWLFLIGASGCGKSSLVHAGLVPRLRELGFEPFSIRPGPEPLAALDRVLPLLTAARRPLLVVDQLEEIFTSAGRSSAHRTEPFLRRLQSLVDDQDTTVVATVRADFYPQLMNTGAWPIVRDHRMELVPLSGPQLSRAISAPAEAVGVRLETTLLNRLVADSDRQPGSLPFLQETMVLLWQHLQYGLLPLSAYESLISSARQPGGVPHSGIEVAMAERADAVMRALPSDESRLIAQRILLRLVQFGDGREDVRRQQSRDSLLSADDDPAVFDSTLRSLVDQHLLTTTSSGDSGSAAMVDLAHEALILGWPSLHSWIEQRRAAEITRRELDAAAATWIRLGRAGGLLDDIELREAERWRRSAEAAQLGLSPAVGQLIEASASALRKSQERRRRMERGLRALSVALAVLLAASLALAFVARAQRDRAIAERATAQSGELALMATSLPETQLDRSLLLAQEAVGLRATPRSHGSLLATLRTNPRVLRMVPFGAALSAVAVSPNGQTLAIGDVTGQVTLIDRATGRAIGPGSSIGGQVHSLAFSPEGTLLAAAGSSGVVQQWRVADGTAAGAPLEGHQGSVRAVAYSPDGRWVATGGADHQVILHSRGAEPGRALSGHQDWVNTLAFTADSRLLITGGGRTEQKSEDGRVLVWDLQSARLVRTLPDQGDAVRGLAVAPDGALATAGADGRVRLWKLPTGSGGTVIARHESRAFSVAFLHQGNVIASASRDGQILLVDRKGKAVGPAMLGHDAAVRALVGLGEDQLATVGVDGRLLVWGLDAAPSRLARAVDAPNRPVRAVATSPTGDLVAMGNDDGDVMIRPAADLRSVGIVIRTGPNPVWGLAFGSAGELATTSSTGTLQLWDAQTGQSRVGPVETGSIAAVVAISADGRTIATGGQDNLVRLWDSRLVPVGQPLAAHTRPIEALAFRSSDGSLVTAGYDGALWLWTGVGADANVPPQGRRLAASTSPFVSVALSPDGTTVVTGDIDGAILFWDAASVGASRAGRPLLLGHAAPVSAVQYTSDGTSLLSADERGAVRLWDLSAGPREVGELGRGAPARTALLLAAQDRFLVGTDTGLTAWVTAPAEWAVTACDVAGRNLRAQEQQDYLGRTSYTPTCPDLPPPPEPAAVPAGDGP